MRSDKISIKWKLFGYLAIIVAVMLALLWTLQIFALEGFYKTIKSRQIRAAADTIRRNIDNENLQELITHYSRRADMSIRITDLSGNDLYQTDRIPDNQIKMLSPEQLKDVYDRAAENNGTFSEFTRSMIPKEGAMDNSRFVGPVPPWRHNNQQSLVFAQIAQRSDGQEVLILLNTMITPVDAVVDTLRVQLLIVTAILLGLSALIALLISHKISNPIIKINRAAKELAKGNYEVIFAGRGYREIAELNDTLNYSARELAKVEGLRRELIANISHDLRTPLTMISGYAEVMRDLPGENTPENLQIIIDETTRLSHLVNDVLDISKLQSGSQQLNRSQFNLTASIRAILWRYAKLMDQQGYFIRFIASADAFVDADETRISQVVYNLINNAVTYTGLDKTVTISQSISNGCVKIEVIDSGQGIPQDKLPLIWERYYKVDKEHKRAAIGTGLGLSIVKSVLTMHDARFGVISTVGQGSIFWFELETVEPRNGTNKEGTQI